MQAGTTGAATKRIVIEGGGFSGAMVAMHLARTSTIPLAIDIVEPRPTLGGGVAYSATDPAHRIKVPASKMTVFVDDPGQFDRWLRLGATLDADPAALWRDGSAFPQRGVFGRHIAGLVAEAAQASPRVILRHDRSTVCDVAPRPDGYALRLEDGATLRADLVILAVSHPPPAVPGPLRGAQDAGAPVIADPWRPGAARCVGWHRRRRECADRRHRPHDGRRCLRPGQARSSRPDHGDIAPRPPFAWARVRPRR